MTASSVHDGDASPDEEFWGEESRRLDEPSWKRDREQRPKPTTRKERRQRRKEWRQEEKARRHAARRSVRFPIFTRSVLLWMLLFALVGVAFGASGAFWWAHFNTQVAELREETRDIDARSAEAVAQIEAERNRTLTEIQGSLEPLQGFLSETRTIQLAQLFGPSVWFVSTLDGEGRPAVGSAFSVVTDPTSTLMVASYTTIQAGTLEPAPEILVRNGSEELVAELVNVDTERDLALLRIPKGDVPVLEWATEEEQSRALGGRVFPVSGLGGVGASLTSGVVVDQSFSGFLSTAPVGTYAQGGPVITADGKVIGIASITYSPLGFDSGQVHFSPYINMVCEVLLDCGGGLEPAAAQPPPPPPAPAPATPAPPAPEPPG